MRDPDGAAVWDPGHTLFSLSAHLPVAACSFQVTGYLAAGFKLTPNIHNQKKQTEDDALGRQIIPSVLSQKHVCPGSGASLCVQHVVLLMVRLDCFIVPVGTLWYSPVFSWLGSDSRGRKLMKCTSGAPWCIMRGCRKAWTSRVINEMPEYWTRARLSSG